jgi:hypothetical protein
LQMDSKIPALSSSGALRSRSISELMSVMRRCYHAYNYDETSQI